MPATSQKQEKLMQAVAHSPEFAKKVGIPQKVGREFTQDERAKVGQAVQDRMKQRSK